MGKCSVRELINMRKNVDPYHEKYINPDVKNSEVWGKVEFTELYSQTKWSTILLYNCNNGYMNVLVQRNEKNVAYWKNNGSTWEHVGKAWHMFHYLQKYVERYLMAQLDPSEIRELQETC